MQSQEIPVAPGQLELRLDRGTRPSTRPVRRKTRRFRAAHWWFARMREAVHTARDWDGQPAGWVAGEQGGLPLPQPHTRLAR